jgi:Flp pilus assembly protein TadG
MPREKRAQALVEFALVAPVIILVMLAILSFGLLFSWRNTLNNAAREGARGGAVCKTDDEIKQIVSNNTALLPHSNTVSVNVSATDASGAALPAGSRARGGAITVTLSYVADVVGIPGIMGSTKTLVGQSTFRMECDTP